MKLHNFPNTPTPPPGENSDITHSESTASAGYLNSETESSSEIRWNPVLISLEEKEPRKRYVLKKRETLLGRDIKMDIAIITDTMVSRRHARICWGNYDKPSEYPRCRFEDLNSRNGSYLNRNPVIGSENLSDGDRIVIGHTLIGFYIKDNREIEFDNSVISMATLDSLTGLVNRRAFQEEARRAIARSVRNKTPMCFAMMDVDSLKEINDGYGHSIGDAVLITAGKLFRKFLRNADIIGRMGGDEFAVLMPNTKMEKALTALKRLQKNLQQKKIKIDDNEIELTISLGLACLESGGDSWDEIYKNADRALYKAKMQGKNQISITCQKRSDSN